MPAPSQTDYVVNVEGVGAFTFARRNIRLQVALDVEVARKSEGVALPDQVALFIRALATLKVLTVAAPEGWSPEEADPFEQDSYDRVMLAWGALREQEETFRKRPQV